MTSEVSSKVHHQEDATPCNLSRSEIDAFAEQCVHALKFKPGEPLRPVVQSLGGRIEYIPETTESEADGSLKVRGVRDFTILLPPRTSPLRDRFTVAHEIGHYVLHSHSGKKRISIQRHGTGRIEWEANWFAAGFLMPRSEFATAFATFSGDVGKLADKFDVSIEAARIRIESLGLK